MTPASDEFVSLASITRDVERFCKIRQWYKYIPWPGEEYVIIFRRGEQPHYSRIERVNQDTLGTHVDLSPLSLLPRDGLRALQVTEETLKHTVFLTPLLRGQEYMALPSSFAVSAPKHVIHRPHCNLDEYREFCKFHHVDIDDTTPDSTFREAALFERERLRMVKEIIDKAVILAQASNIYRDDEEPIKMRRYTNGRTYKQ
jgi:hypothetical protein